MASVKVYPGAKRPTHEISLSDGVRTFGLRLAKGPRSIREVPVTPSTVHFSGGGTKFGDWEPGMSHIEQRTWAGGRGQADFVDDPTRYFDAKMAWTLTPGKVFPAPQWKFADPKDFFSEGYQHLPGSLKWHALIKNNDEGIGSSFTHSLNWAGYDSAWLWVRRVGRPGNLTVGLREDDAGSPTGGFLASSTIQAQYYEEGVAHLVEFNLSGGSALVGTTSWLMAENGNGTFDSANHWEIGVDENGSGAVLAGGLSWESTGIGIYYRVLAAAAKRKWRFFEYRGALYAVDQPADGSSSSLMINGDRGKATAGTSTTLTDGNKSWTADGWIGAYVKIIKGTGAGQSRRITDNSSTALTVGDAWDITPGTDSLYVIYHTPVWQDISPTSGDQFDAACTCVGVIDEQVTFGFDGEATGLKMRWNEDASPPAHEFNDHGAGVYCHFIAVMHDDAGDLNFFRFRSEEGEYAFCQRASKSPWGTDYTFTGRIDIGSSNQPITGVAVHGGELYAFKPDGRYRITVARTAYDEGVATGGTATTLTDMNKSWTANAYREHFVKIQAGTGVGQVRKIAANTATVLTVSTGWDTSPDTSSVYTIFKDTGRAAKEGGETGFIRSRNNGEAALSNGQHLYLSWGGYALLRMPDSGGDSDFANIGPSRDEGLPDDRRGRVVDLTGTPQGIVAAVRGDSVSSVLALPVEGEGWHEVFRGWAAGKGIDRIYFQDSHRPRLWIAIGGELVYQDWPRQAFNPLIDTGMKYHHEAILVSSTIDMGASRLPKLIKEVSAITENLAGGIEIDLDYQINEEVGTDTWIWAGTFQAAPEDTLPVGAGEVYRVRFRLRMRTNNEETPPVLLATVLEGFARTPVKYRWDLRLKIGDTRLDKSGAGYDHDPDEFLAWLKAAATSSTKIMMRSVWAQLDNREVIIEPPSLLRQFTNDVMGFWGGQVEVNLREI